MADSVCNIAKGRLVEWYYRVKNNDPANCAFILVPLETTGLEADSALIDKDDLTALVSGTTNEQTTMGRKTLTDAELAAFPAPDDTNNRFDIAIPTVQWAAAAGNAISKVALCFDYDTTAGTDAAILPGILFDAVMTPDGTTYELTGATIFRAS